MNFKEKQGKARYFPCFILISLKIIFKQENGVKTAPKTRKQEESKLFYA